MGTASGTAQLSVRLPVDMVDAIDTIAAALDRDRTWVIVHALTR